MQQTSFEANVTDEQDVVEMKINREEQAKQWLEGNREAIESYKNRQSEQGETFSDWVGQV